MNRKEGHNDFNVLMAIEHIVKITTDTFKG